MVSGQKKFWPLTTDYWPLNTDLLNRLDKLPRFGQNKPMNIELEEMDGVTVATLFGELDSRTAPIVQEKLLTLPEPNGKALLDMSGVSYISSAGLRALLMLYRQMAARDGRVALVGLTENIRDVMSVTGFLDFFNDYETLEAGLAALRAESGQ